MLPYQVYNHHDCIISSGLGEFNNKVHAHDIPAFFWDEEWLEFTGWLLVLDLGLEAEVAGGYIAANVLGHVGPPVVAQDQFQGLEPPSMSCNLGVMGKGDNAPMEV